jgi:hypothetical protein
MNPESIITVTREMIGLLRTLCADSNAGEMEDKNMKRPARIMPADPHQAYTRLLLLFLEMLRPIPSEIIF